MGDAYKDTQPATVNQGNDGVESCYKNIPTLIVSDRHSLNPAFLRRKNGPYNYGFSGLARHAHSILESVVERRIGVYLYQHRLIQTLPRTCHHHQPG
jgi:hypothetical protein